MKIMFLRAHGIASDPAGMRITVLRQKVRLAPLAGAVAALARRPHACIENAYAVRDRSPPSLEVDR